MTDMVSPAVFIRHSVPEIAEKLVRPQPLTLPSPRREEDKAEGES
jgi:hypothetical protein